MGRLKIILAAMLLTGVVHPFAQLAPGPGSGIDRNVKPPTSFASSYDAVQYYKKLTEPMPELKKANFEYVQAVTRMRSAKSVERKRQDLLNVMTKNKAYFQSNPAFGNDSTLKCELVRFLDLTEIVLREDFVKILDMEDIAARSYDQEEAHQLAIDMAVDKINACHDTLRKADDGFFAKYNIIQKKDKDELALKIEKADTAIRYYNSITRIFSKAHREDLYAREASNKKDIAGLEQHKASLLSFSEEGLNQLKKKDGLDGDKYLLSAAEALLEFYKNDGQITYQANIDFYMKTDELSNANKRINSIRPEDRKKEDVDRFNEMVDAYNKSVKQINDINKKSFKIHSQLLDMWNDQVEKFFKRHAP